MKATDFKKEYFRNNSEQKEILKRDIAFQTSRMITHARLIAGMTQGELAEAMRTKQPSIARAENGNTLPSLAFLVKMGKALRTYLLPLRFASVPESLLSDDFSSEIKTMTKDWSTTQFHFPVPSTTWMFAPMGSVTVQSNCLNTNKTL